MPLLGPAVVQRPNQIDQAGDANALNIAHYTGVVESTIERHSVLEPMIPKRTVKGTNTITNFAVGKSELQVLVPGEAPGGTKSDVGKKSLTIDTPILARQMTPLIDEFQTSYDYRKYIGEEHGKEHAKFKDEAFFIQAIKAAMLTNSAYSTTAGKPAGHKGGSIQTIASAAAAEDPAQLYSAISKLFVQMEEKDVVPRRDDVVIAFRPKHFYALQEADQIVNGDYKTADGTVLSNQAIFKAWGCPVLSTTNLPNTNITAHKLSNAANGNAYNGDFTKVIGVALSPRALLAGEMIPLTTKVHYDDTWLHWFIDAYQAFGVTSDRAEFAGLLTLA